MTAQRAVKPTRKPKLGQNFLVDRSVIEKIVAALGDVSRSLVVEIGPGRGALTRVLVERAGKLVAIEYDRILAAQLRMELSARRNLEILEADVLTADFDRIVQPALGGITDRQPVPELRKARVVGNLPYYITSDILLRLFEYSRNFEMFVITVQREVAERIAATPGNREYGLLTVTAQLYCDIEKLLIVPPGAFSPPPKVHSAVLRMKVAPKLAALNVEERPFIAFLKVCFAQKRKTLVNNLKPTYGAAAAAVLKQLKLRSDVRAEALSLPQLAAVYQGVAHGIAV